MLFVLLRNERLPITDTLNLCVDHVNGGLDTLTYQVHLDSPSFQLSAEENRLEYGDNHYIIKAVDSPGKTANITALLDLDFLKAQMHKAYSSQTRTLTEVLSEMLPGWTITGAAPEIRRTINLSNARDYDVVMTVASIYNIKYRWHTVKKSVEIIGEETPEPSGAYVTDELNLRSVAFKGETTSFATRLYPYGKEMLSIDSVNGGLEYVENHQYSDKIISAVWADERFTIPENLKEEAKKRLAIMSAPVRSYECDVIDIAKWDERYHDFSFSLYQVITLIDRRNRLRMNHQIVDYKEFPDSPQRNVITLSSVVPKLQDSMTDYMNQQIDEAKKDAEKQISNYDLAVKRLNSVLTNAMGFYNTSVKQEDGSEIYYTHDKPTLAESMVIWKRTVDGFGVSKDGGKTYHAGFTKDGNAVVCVLDAVGVNADWVRTGKILSPNNPYVYFDLDKGVIAASKLVSSEEGATDVAAKIGTVTFSGGGTSQGLALSGSKGLIGLFSQIYPESQTNNRGMEAVALGALRLRSNASSTSDDNAIELYNDTSQNGCFELRLSRGTHSDTYAIQFTADKALFIKDFSDDGSQMSGIRIYQDRMEVTTGNGRNGLIIKEGRIGFKTAGSERGSIDANGWHGHFDIPTPSGVTTQVGIMRSDGSARTMQFENGIFTGYV